MFPIIRYGADSEEKGQKDKDSILKSLRKNAKKRRKSARKNSNCGEEVKYLTDGKRRKRSGELRGRSGETLDGVQAEDSSLLINKNALKEAGIYKDGSGGIQREESFPLNNRGDVDDGEFLKDENRETKIEESLSSNSKDVSEEVGNLEDENGEAQAAESSFLDSKDESDNDFEDSGNIPEDYDPLKMFKLGLKAPKKVSVQELLKTGGEKLPEWLENPYLINPDVNSSNLDLKTNLFHELLQNNLIKTGVNRLFPVQACLIPALLYGIQCDFMVRPNDICVCSPTGSGKTLAFAIPIVQYLLDSGVSSKTQGLVVVPTIELAKQVYDVFMSVSQGSEIKCVLLGGGQVDSELKNLVKKSKFGFYLHPDVIVSTPGRLAHFLETPNALNLEYLRFLVIDEADRVLDLVKQSWLTKLKQQLPQWQKTSHMVTIGELATPKLVVQKLLFSATLTPDPEKLKDLDLFKPRLFVAKKERKPNLPATIKQAKYSIPPSLKQFTVCCEANVKPLVVLSLVIKLNLKKVLCFTKSAESAHRLHLLVKEYIKLGKLNIPCLEFSSLLQNKERKRNIAQFTSKSECILVSSDAAARGLDTTDIEAVVLYDIPQYIEAYVHRAGRASRAGKEGSVYSLVTPTDMHYYKKLFKNARLHLPQDYSADAKLLSTLSGSYENALTTVQSEIELSNQAKRRK